MHEPGSQFLNKKYNDLHASKEVTKAVDDWKKRGKAELPSQTDKNKKIQLFLDRLEKIFDITDRIKLEARTQRLKQNLYELFTIKEADIPDRYYEHQKEILKQQGYGNVEITEKLRYLMAQDIIAEQQHSLDTWIDYLVLQNDAKYPTWFRYYVIRNVLNLCPYNKKDKSFKKRTTHTVAVFPDIDYEALAYVYDEVSHAMTEEGKVEPPHDKDTKGEKDEWWKILKKMNFGELYAYSIEHVTPSSQEEREQTTGEWVKYDQGSDSLLLVKTLQGKGTAKKHLQFGDFYVYHTRDKKGKNTIPRIAIRMENGRIAEIRGVDPDQEIEPSLLEIAIEKARPLPGYNEFRKKSHDMQLLTDIETKSSLNEKLTLSELKFLYEIDYKIEGFSGKKDPRIKEIVKKRNQKEDYARIYSCNINQVATEDDKITDETIVFIGVLSRISTEKWINFPKNLKVVVGSADFHDSKVPNYGNLETVTGDFIRGTATPKNINVDVLVTYK